MKGKEMYKKIVEAARILRKRIPHLKPDYLIITGSGLKDAIVELENPLTIPYSEIPYFPPTTVKGHLGELVYGGYKGSNLAIMRGRFHYYEGHPITFISFPIRLFNYLGASKLIVTAAVGSLKKSIKPGDIVIITDHINLMNTNPLIGNYDERFGEMFVDMSQPYKEETINNVCRELRRRRIKHFQGVYVAVSGPCYETKAEARMYRMIGGDVIGMSVVPEVISARQLRMDVFGVCWVSNYVGGISTKVISHDEVLEMGKEATKRIKQIIELVLEKKLL